jgi:hypothetical protein
MARPPEPITQRRAPDVYTDPRSRLPSLILKDPLLQAGACEFTGRVAASRGVPGQYVLWLVGDSTFRNQYVALCTAMDSLDMAVGKQLADKPRPAACTGRLGPTRMVVVFWEAVQFESKLRVMKETKRAYGLPRPDAVYFGAGLWQLWPTIHVGNRRHRVRGPPRWQAAAKANRTAGIESMWAAYNGWRTYEHALNATLQAYHLLGAHSIVVSNVHSPCSKWFAQPPATMELCVEGLRLRRGVSLPNAVADCHSGMRGSAGVDALNRKVMRTTSAFSRGKDAPRVRLVDSFDLTHGRCELVADDRAPVHDNGVHYVPLLYHELILLFEALSWFRNAPPRHLPATPPWRLPISKSTPHRIRGSDEARTWSKAHGSRATLVAASSILARRCYVARLDPILGRHSAPAPDLAFGRELPHLGVESRRSSSCSARAPGHPRNVRADYSINSAPESSKR